jgi:hypothetical protein
MPRTGAHDRRELPPDASSRVRSHVLLRCDINLLALLGRKVHPRVSRIVVVCIVHDDRLLRR